MAAASARRSDAFMNAFTESAPISSIGGSSTSFISTRRSAVFAGGQATLGEHAEQHVLATLGRIGLASQ